MGSCGDESPEDFEEASIIKWRIPRSHRGAHILRKLFSQFIKEIVEGMIGFVRLPTIMSKLLSDNGSQEFGDFKLTILGMLGTYGFERRILVHLLDFFHMYTIVMQLALYADSGLFNNFKKKYIYILLLYVGYCQVLNRR